MQVNLSEAEPIDDDPIWGISEVERRKYVKGREEMLEGLKSILAGREGAWDRGSKFLRPEVEVESPMFKFKVRPLIFLHVDNGTQIYK